MVRPCTIPMLAFFMVHPFANWHSAGQELEKSLTENPDLEITGDTLEDRGHSFVEVQFSGFGVKYRGSVAQLWQEWVRWDSTSSVRQLGPWICPNGSG